MSVFSKVSFTPFSSFFRCLLLLRVRMICASDRMALSPEDRPWFHQRRARAAIFTKPAVRDY